MSNIRSKLKIVICGKKNSGKTSLIYRWKLEDFIITQPTIIANFVPVSVTLTSLSNQYDDGRAEIIKKIYNFNLNFVEISFEECLANQVWFNEIVNLVKNKKTASAGASLACSNATWGSVATVNIFLVSYKA